MTTTNTTNTTDAKKYFVLKVSETIGEYQANAKTIVRVEPEKLDEYVEALLLTDWRGEAEFNEEDEVFQNGEISWYLTEAIEVPDQLAEELIQYRILNLL